MTTLLDTYKDKLTSTSKKARLEAIHDIVKSKDEQALLYLLSYLNKTKVPNALALTIKAIGDSGNKNFIDTLISIYGKHKNEQSIILEALLKLGVFEKYISGYQLHDNIKEQLNALLGGCNSNQLKVYLSLPKAEFLEKLDFYSKLWRNKNKKG